MTMKQVKRKRKATAGDRILAGLQDALDWVEGRDTESRATVVEVPVVDVRAVRKRLGLSQAAFSAKFGVSPATLRNWEQGRVRPDGPARVLLAVLDHHPEAVEDALRKAS